MQALSTEFGILVVGTTTPEGMEKHEAGIKIN